MAIKLFLMVLISYSMLGCQKKEKFSGKSESEFKISRFKVEKDLNNKEKDKLEISLKLITEREKSSNDIFLDIIDNKTYNELIDWTEDYIKKEKTSLIDSINNKIKELNEAIKEYENITNTLNAFKATNISIDTTRSGVPFLKMEVLNTKKIDNFKGYQFELDIYDIEQNKKIDSYGFGATYKETRDLNGENSSFSIKNYSLEPIVNESKGLQNLLKTVTLPTNNLNQFGLRTEFNVIQLEFGDGTIINQPEHDITFYESEINKLNATIKNLKNVKISNFSDLKKSIINSEH